MKFRTATAVAAVLAAGCVGVSTTASAQSAPPPPPAGAPPAPPPGVCYRSHDDHVAGTVIGGLAGAAIGSNLAAHHGGRAGGAILGGLLGMIVGHDVAENHAPPPPGCHGYGYGGGYYRPAVVAVYPRPYYRHYWAPYPYYYPAPVVVAAPPPPPPGYYAPPPPPQQ